MLSKALSKKKKRKTLIILWNNLSLLFEVQLRYIYFSGNLCYVIPDECFPLPLCGRE